MRNITDLLQTEMACFLVEEGTVVVAVFLALVKQEALFSALAEQEALFLVLAEREV